MKPFAFILLVPIALSGFGMGLSQVHVEKRGLDLCPSAVTINSTTISVKGNTIQKTTFECLDDGLLAHADTVPLAKKAPVIVPNSFLELSRRNADECKNAAPECQCGQPTTCICTDPTPDGPTGNDCSALIDALKVIPQIEGATFVVQPRTFQLLQFQSCAIEWSNLGTGSRPGPLEYCWDEVVALTGLSNQDCLETGISTGASCSPGDVCGFWGCFVLAPRDKRWPKQVLF